ncbi:MAG: hypothetical protein KF745_07650 [Phycisphaeraceae bacterium]|nr:hypothetical protein [Phycisphaeraceae bacterium]
MKMMPCPAAAPAACLAAILLAAGAAPAQVPDPAEHEAPAAAVAPASPAREVPDGDPNDSDPLRSLMPAWAVKVTPIAWWVGAAGDIKLPGGSAEVSVSDLGLDDPRLSPAGTIEVALDHWRFGFGGAAYSINQPNATATSGFQIGDLVFNAGDSLGTSLDFADYQLLAGGRICAYDFKRHSKPPEGAMDSVVSLFLLGGVEVMDTSVSVVSNEAGGGSSSDGQTFVQPIAALRAEALFARDFGINIQLSGGGMAWGDTTSASFDLALMFNWYPAENVGLQFGWRQLLFWVSDGDEPSEFQYNGSLAGLFGSVVIRF